jgi:uncharacterized membrane protein
MEYPHHTSFGAIVMTRTIISYSLDAELKSDHQTKALPP